MIKLNTEKEMRVVMNVGEYYELGFYVGCSPTCLGVLGQAAPAWVWRPIRGDVALERTLKFPLVVKVKSKMKF